MRSLVFAAATILTGSLFAADPELMRLAMPDATVMAGVNMEELRLSPLGQFIQTQTTQHPDPSLQKLIENTGFDPRRDLREILVCSTGFTGGKSGILLFRGTFDVPRILEWGRADGATIETYKGVSIAQKSKQESVAFLDSTLAIAGSQEDVRAAIDRKTAPAAIPAALAAQVSQLSGSEDAWFVTTTPISTFQPAPPETTPGGAPNPADVYSKVQQSSGGVKFGANIVVALQALLPTDQDAAALATLLQTMGIGLSQAGGSKGDFASAASLLQYLSVTSEGPVTKISWSVSEAQIEEPLKASFANQTQGEKKELKTRSAPDTGATGTYLGVPGSESGVPQRIHVGREVQKAKLIQHVEPVYPPLALQAKVSGVVRLNAIIGKDGTVRNVVLVSGHPLLATAAMEAVRQWTYEPTLLNGQAVEVATQIEVSFTLTE